MRNNGDGDEEDDIVPVVLNADEDGGGPPMEEEEDDDDEEEGVGGGEEEDEEGGGEEAKRRSRSVWKRAVDFFNLGVPRVSRLYDEDDLEPWLFKENHVKYHVCCGALHVKCVVVTGTVLKSIFVLFYTAWKIMSSSTSHVISALTSIFGLSLILTSYAFLVIGVIVKKYTLLIPYFTLCMFLILILIMKLFIDVISTANTKDTLEPAQLQLILVQTMIIVVEIYSVFVVWKAFNYITDYCMEKDYLWNLKLADLRRQHISNYMREINEEKSADERKREAVADAVDEVERQRRSQSAVELPMFLAPGKAPLFRKRRASELPMFHGTTPTPARSTSLFQPLVVMSEEGEEKEEEERTRKTDKDGDDTESRFPVMKSLRSAKHRRPLHQHSSTSSD